MSRSRRAGFSLVEMIFAVSITVLVFAIAIPFFRAQTRAVDAGAGRLDAFQSARYAVWRLEADLRLAGGETGQPVIVQAAPFAIAFNANRVGRTTASDPNASYWDSSLDTLTTQSWMTSRAATLRTSAKTYPTQNYTDANGASSKSETIQYYLLPDTSGGSQNQYVLYRKVNDRDSTLVVRHLYVPSDSQYFFRYYTTNAAGTITTLANSSLPIYWDDSLARADSITAVQLRATGEFWDSRSRSNVYRDLYTLVRLRNAVRVTPVQCGAAPPAPDTLGVLVETAPAGQKMDVRLDWSGVTGDSTGAKDVRQYVLLRRLSGATTWTAIGSRPARRASAYRFQDFTISAVAAGTYEYGVQARDCSGASSVRVGTSTVTMP